MSQAGAGSHIFVSYSPADHRLVKRLVDNLRGAGFKIWLAPRPVPRRDLQPDEEQAASTGIITSAVFVVVLSRNAVKSPWVRHEVQLALSAGRSIIPILADQISPGEIPPPLAYLPSVSFVRRSYEDSFGALVLALARGTGLSHHTFTGEALGGTAPAPDAAPPPVPPVPPAPVAPEPSAPQNPRGGLTLTGEPIARAPRPRERGAPRTKRREPGRDRRAPGSEAAARTLQFSAYSPNEIPTATWSTLLVYTYVAEALQQIQADAATFTELGSAPKEARGQSTRRVRQGVELTIEPHIDGVVLSPPSDTFVWRGAWHRSLFRVMADTRLDGVVQNGWIDVYAGRMAPIASIELSLSFHRTIPKNTMIDPGGMAVTANTFDTVFISYSHRDEEAMRQACEAYDQLGIGVLVDEWLPAGTNYEEQLEAMIRSANVLHLLWSRNSAASDYVRREWTLALASGKGERFIRPWYWRKPLVSPPAELEARRVSFKYERLKRRVLKPVTWF